MLKRNLVMVLVLAFILMLTPQGSYAAPIIIDKSQLDKGFITIGYTNMNEVKAILRLTKGDVRYEYSVVQGAQYPLQLGNGTYNLLIAELTSDNKYKVVHQENIELQMVNENIVFLQSISLINWNQDTKAVVEAALLTENTESDADKVAAIYSYVTQNFKYDYDKAVTIETGYVPNLDESFDAKNGICYDYTTIFAAMTRSQGIPTRLLMGYEVNTPDVYHAWNQVYLKDTDEWLTIDTTFDATLIQDGVETSMIKNESDYAATKVY